MPETLVLSEDEALELLAFLVTAAQILPDEPADYGPMRLVSAAQRLCAWTAPRCGEEMRALLSRLSADIPAMTPHRLSDPGAYQTFLEESSREIARVLARRAGREV